MRLSLAIAAARTIHDPGDEPVDLDTVCEAEDEFRPIGTLAVWIEAIDA